MTRGYFLVVRKGKIEDGVYLSSSAYPAYYGVQILQAIMKEEIPQFMEANRETNDEEDNDDLTKVPLTEFIKTGGKGKSEEDVSPVMYPEYTYILYQPSQQLKVFRYGESIYQIRREDFERAQFAFKNEHLLRSVLSIDEKTCIRLLDGEKELNKLIRFGVSEDFLYGIITGAPSVSIAPQKAIWNRCSTFYPKDAERVCRISVIAPVIRDDASLDWDNMDEPGDVEAVFRDTGHSGGGSSTKFYPVIHIGKIIALDVARRGSRYRSFAGALSTCHKETAAYILEHQQELLNLVIAHELMKKGQALMGACRKAGFPEAETEAALAFAGAAIERIKGFPTATNSQIESAHNKLLSVLSDDVLNIYGETGRHESRKE